MISNQKKEILMLVGFIINKISLGKKKKSNKKKVILHQIQQTNNKLWINQEQPIKLKLSQ